MNKLLNVLASAVGCLVAAMFTVACSSEDDQVMKFDFDIKGKVFVHSYEDESAEAHVAGTEILEFKTSDSVVRYNLFCILAGDYLKMDDYEERGQYGVVDNAVVISLGDSMTTAKLFVNNEGLPVLNWPGLGEYVYSDLTVDGNQKMFNRLHTHNLVDPRVKDADSILTVEKKGRYFGCSDRKSFVMNVDSLSGSHATNNQIVSFTISGIPGQFVLSEATGNIYLMRFGTMAYAPVDKEMADSNPKDVVAILMCDDKFSDYTLVTPSLVNGFKNTNVHTIFAKLNPLLY